MSYTISCNFQRYIASYNENISNKVYIRQIYSVNVIRNSSIIIIMKGLKCLA